MTLSILKHIKPVAKLAAAISVITLGFSGCGSGGGSSDSSPATIRPKTLDGILLVLDTNVRFEFVRNTGSPPALVSGDVESGTFFYTLGGVQRRTYSNTNGDNSDVRFPDSVSTASYTYRAINESSGLLTLTGVGVNDLNTTGGFAANNGSFVYFFNTDSDGNTNHVVEIDLTFSSDGNSISSGMTTVRIPGGSPLYDTVRIPSTVALVAGGLVPENYNPTIDPLRPSLIAPESLDDVLIVFTNGIPDPNFDFTIQFVAETVGVPSGGNEETEVGQGFLRVADSPVDDAVDYTWKRIAGTDDGTLTISGSNSTFDGRYTLKFMGSDNGAYIGEVDGGTANAAEVSGTFFLPGLSDG